MSIIACFPRYLQEMNTDSEYDYTSGEKWLGLFMGRRLFQTTLTIPISSIPLTGLTTYNKYNHGISDIDIPLFVKDVSLKDASTNTVFSKLADKMQAESQYTSQDNLYLERFTKTQLWIIRGTSAANETDTLYVTIQYFKVGK